MCPEPIRKNIADIFQDREGNVVGFRVLSDGRDGVLLVRVDADKGNSLRTELLRQVGEARCVQFGDGAFRPGKGEHDELGLGELVQRASAPR